MSFIEMGGIGDTHEAKVAPEGKYDLVIESAKIKEKEGNKNIFCVILIENNDDEEYANLLHNVSIPGPDDEPEKKKFKMLFLRRFLDQFQIPYDESGFDIETFAGSRASQAKIKQDEYQGQRKNILELDPIAE